MTADRPTEQGEAAIVQACRDLGYDVTPREPWLGWVVAPSRPPGRALLMVVELVGIVLAIAAGLSMLFLIGLGCFSLVAIAP